MHFVKISTFRGYYLHLVDIYVLRVYYPHLMRISIFRRCYPYFVEISTSLGYYPHYVEIYAFCGYFLHFFDIIYIYHITIYLACNWCPIFHIYSFSESDWCITSFTVCNLIVFYVTLPFDFFFLWVTCTQMGYLPQWSLYASDTYISLA